MSKELISLRLPDEVKTKLENLSKATGRTRSFLAIEALEEYLKTQDWQIKAIQEGLKEAENGIFIDHESLKKKWEAKRARAVDKAGRKRS